MDYFVPNFGMDKNIIASQTDEKVAEALVGHAWNFKTPESWEKYRNRAKDTDYNFDPELSEEIRASFNSQKIAENMKSEGEPFSWTLTADEKKGEKSLL